MSHLEQGRTGRVVYARLCPNEDLVQTVEKLCLQHGIEAAVIRGSLGSLSQACLDYGGERPFDVDGPAIELLTLTGEVRADKGGVPHAKLAGTVAGPDGVVRAGRFVTGRNPVCITCEVVLEEWLREAA